MATRLFRKLRGAIAAAGTTCREISEELGINPATLSAKMNGKQPFTLWEAYQILSMLDLPESEINTYFPPDGRYRENV